MLRAISIINLMRVLQRSFLDVVSCIQVLPPTSRSLSSLNW